MFLHVSVIHSVRRGEHLTRYTPQTRYTPRNQVHPLEQTCTPLWTRYTPPEQTPPQTRYTPPGLGTHPGADTPLDQVHPAGPATPPGADTPPTRYTHPRRADNPPWDQVHPPRADIPPGPGTPPLPGPGTPPRAEHAGRYGQRAGGRHPTGMQSCCCRNNVCSGPCSGTRDVDGRTSRELEFNRSINN